MAFIGEISTAGPEGNSSRRRRCVWGSTKDNDSLMVGLRHQPAQETDVASLVYPGAYQTESPPRAGLLPRCGASTRSRHRPGHAAAHRDAASVVPGRVSALGSGRVESLADVRRACNHQPGVEVACKTLYDRLVRVGCATFMRGMLARLIDQ